MHPGVLNAANEVVVDAFLKDKVGFLQMSDIIADTLQKCTFVKNPSLEDYIASDAEARRITKTIFDTMTETLIQAAQFFLSLSILIVLHELGHFIPAKLFKTRVEKFYLFFDPYFSLIKKKIGDTEYGIGWLPLGGYVKISGMIDESMDKEQLKEEPKPWEFRSKPAWQRLIIMLGGVTVNVLLAMFIYAMILFTWGSSYLKTENAIYGIQCSEFAKEIGFQNGDKIITVDGVYYENFNELPEAILLSGKTTEVLLDRNGEQVRVEIPSNIIEQFIENNSSSGFINFAYPSVVEKFVEGSVAESAGLKPGDQLIGLNGEEVLYVSDYINTLSSFINEKKLHFLFKEV